MMAEPEWGLRVLVLALHDHGLYGRKSTDHNIADDRSALNG